MAISRKVDEGVLSEAISAEAAGENVWEPDYDYCWCDKCHESRRLSDTHCD